MTGPIENTEARHYLAGVGHELCIGRYRGVEQLVDVIHNAAGLQHPFGVPHHLSD